jgi:hypothetical protein
MSKKIILLIFSFAIFITSTFIIVNKSESNNSRYENIVELNSLAYAGDYNDFSNSNLYGGSGSGGLGLLIIIGIDYIIENMPDKPNSNPGDSDGNTFDYVSDVLSNHTLDSLNESTLTESQISELIYSMTGLSVNELGDDNKKSLYLGTMEDNYNKVAEDNDGIAFYNENYSTLVNQIGLDNMWIINSIIIEIAIYNQWNIYLVSNPNLYYDVATKTMIQPNRGYAKELWLINAINNKYWYFNGTYWKVNVA